MTLVCHGGDGGDGGDGGRVTGEQSPGEVWLGRGWGRLRDVGGSEQIVKFFQSGVLVPAVLGLSVGRVRGDLLVDGREGVGWRGGGECGQCEGV